MPGSVGDAGRRALVVGGSAGIGLALAHELARHGHGLVLVARQEPRLAAAAADLVGTYAVPVDTIALDATAPEAPDELARVLTDRHLQPDVLVLSAGRWSYREVGRLSRNELRAILEANAIAPHAMLAAMAPLMPDGAHIMFVGSLAALSPIPYAAAYSGAKACLYELALALRCEPNPRRFVYSFLAPGLVATDFVPSKGTGLARVFLEVIASKPDMVARAGYRGIRWGSFLIVPGVLWKLLWLGSLIVPKRLVSAVLTSLFQRPA
jgi:short-subunit dehydrogenase